MRANLVLVDMLLLYDFISPGAVSELGVNDPHDKSPVTLKDAPLITPVEDIDALLLIDNELPLIEPEPADKLVPVISPDEFIDALLKVIAIVFLLVITLFVFSLLIEYARFLYAR